LTPGVRLPFMTPDDSPVRAPDYDDSSIQYQSAPKVSSQTCHFFGEEGTDQTNIFLVHPLFSFPCCLSLPPRKSPWLTPELRSPFFRRPQRVVVCPQEGEILEGQNRSVQGPPDRFTAFFPPAPLMSVLPSCQDCRDLRSSASPIGSLPFPWGGRLIDVKATLPVVILPLVYVFSLHR